MIFELITGYAAIRIIGDSINKRKLAQLELAMHELPKTRDELDEIYKQEKLTDDYHAKQRALIESDKQMEIEYCGALIQRDDHGRYIKVDGGYLLENGDIFIDKQNNS